MNSGGGGPPASPPHKAESGKSGCVVMYHGDTARAFGKSKAGLYLPLALVVREGDLLELAVLEDGGGREAGSGLLNKRLGRHIEL